MYSPDPPIVAVASVIRRHLTPALLLGCLVGSQLLTGCGDDGPIATPASKSMPDCSEVWVAGKTLPADYAGCVGSDGVLEASEIKKCSTAKGSFVSFDSDYFAILGGEISDEGTDSAAYNAAYLHCFGQGW